MTFAKFLLTCLAVGLTISANSATQSYTTNETSLYSLDPETGSPVFIGYTAGVSGSVSSDLVNPRNSLTQVVDSQWDMAGVYAGSMSNTRYTAPFLEHLEGYNRDVYAESHLSVEALIYPDGSGSLLLTFVDRRSGSNPDLTRSGEYYRALSSIAPAQVPAGTLSAFYGQPWTDETAAFVFSAAFSYGGLFQLTETWRTNSTDFREPDIQGERIEAGFTAPVPEASTWALMLAGLAVIGAAVRARRRA